MKVDEESATMADLAVDVVVEDGTAQDEGEGEGEESSSEEEEEQE